jgi:Protein of unknown function (DUF2795)
MVIKMAKVNPIELQKYLKGVDYPARRDSLLSKADENGADENIRSMLEQLPDQDFETPTEVNKAIGALE